MDAAGPDLQRALALARATGRPWVALQCLSHLAWIAAAQSDMRAVQVAADDAVAVATAHGWAGSTPLAAVALAQGWAAYQRLDDSGTEAVLPTVHRAVHAADASTALSATLLEAFVAFERSEDRHGLVTALREAWRRPRDGHVPPWLVTTSALTEQRMALQVGEPAWAGAVVEQAERVLGECGDVQVLRAVTQAHRGRPDAARRLLMPVVAGVTACVVPLNLVEAWLWDARLASRAHDATRAHASLVEALTLGASHQLMRPFVAGGQELHDMLAAGAGRFGRLEAFATRLRSATASPDRDSIDLLTPRELELLQELPSLRTAEEIASTMFVSVNTVKTHLRGIYRKLGVANRREAIVLARRRGLL